MSTTKRQYVEQAFAEVGLAGYLFDITPEELNTALRQLDSMIALWNAKGIRLGWPMPSSPQNSDLDDVTETADSASDAIVFNLAIRVARSFGKAVDPEVKAMAKQAYDTLLIKAAMPMQRQLPAEMPLGAGNKPWRWQGGPFVRPPKDPVLAGQDGPIEYD